MPATRDIKRRIRSVKSTQQITRAMKFVAAAKLRRAQERMLALRPYADRLGAVMHHLATELVGDEHPLLRPMSPTPKRIAFVLVAGDRGLCGGFNTAIVRMARQEAERLPAGCEAEFYCVGKRASQGIRQTTKFRTAKSYYDVFEKLSFTLAGDLCRQLVERMASKGDDRIDGAVLVYSRFVNSLSQKPTVEPILPLFFPEEMSERDPDAPRPERTASEGPEYATAYSIEPDVPSALAPLVTRWIGTAVYRAMVESYAAELSARMAAMDNATTNADEMIGGLTLQFNRARQSGITAELIDIVGGAGAQQ